MTNVAHMMNIAIFGEDRMFKAGQTVFLTITMHSSESVNPSFS